MTRNASLDYTTLVDRRVSIRIMDGGSDSVNFPDRECGYRIAAKLSYSKDDYAGAVQGWSAQSRPHKI
jgi:hypothetical protein